MNYKKIIYRVILNEDVLGSTKTKSIVDAIKNRNKITFMYNGPADIVKSGVRTNVEAVAIGLSKKGNLIIRAWIDSPPSVSKTTTANNHWRTFIVDRMSDIKISDEIFNNKRPLYNERADKTMSVVYVNSDWTRIPATRSIDKPQKIEKKDELSTTQSNSTQTTNLPQPKTTPIPSAPKGQEKPETLPQPPKIEKPANKPQTAQPEEKENLAEQIKRIKTLLF